MGNKKFDPTYLYLMKDRDKDLFKIGVSKDPKKRLAQVSKVNGTIVRDMYIFGKWWFSTSAEARKYEKMWQDFFSLKGLLSHGEFYKLSTKQADYIISSHRDRYEYKEVVISSYASRFNIVHRGYDGLITEFNVHIWMFRPSDGCPILHISECTYRGERTGLGRFGRQPESELEYYVRYDDLIRATKQVTDKKIGEIYISGYIKSEKKDMIEAIEEMIHEYYHDKERVYIKG